MHINKNRTSAEVTRALGIDFRIKMEAHAGIIYTGV